MQEMPLLINNFGQKKKKRKSKSKTHQSNRNKLRAILCVLLSVVFHSVGQFLKDLYNFVMHS